MWYAPGTCPLQLIERLAEHKLYALAIEEIRPSGCWPDKGIEGDHRSGWFAIRRKV